jgi:peptide/nickel transport system substrate-binding protein
MTKGEQGRRRAGRAAVTLASAGLLLGATFATSAHIGFASHAAAAKAPTYGGSMSIRSPTAPDCLDTQKTAAAASSNILSLVLSPLLSIDTKGHYVGNLATKYKVAGGGTKVTFFLRKNVTFSNGDPLTSADVKFTFDRALDPATKSPVSASMLGQVQAVKAIDKYTVELDLKAAFRPLLTNLAGSYTGILDKKSILAQGTSTCNNPIGSGPYKVQSTGTAFDDVVLVANPRHNFAPNWVQNKGKPYITKLEYKTISSDATAISELLSSGIDFATIPGTQLSRVQGNSSFAIHKLPAANLIFIEFNTGVAPFNDVDVRRAFAEIVNRSNIVQAALGGLGQVVNGPIPPAIPFYDKAAAKLMPKFNISAAAKIISAKHATGPYNLMIVGIPTFTTVAEILQQAAAQAGMTLNIVTKGGLGDYISAAAKGDFNVLSLNYSYSDPDILYFLLHSSQGKGAGLNWTNESNPAALDALIVKGRTTLAAKKVAPIYAKAQQMINKQLEFLGVAAQTPILAIRTNIKGYHVDSLGVIAYEDLYIKSK